MTTAEPDYPSAWRVETIADIASPHPRSIAIGPFGSRMKADVYVRTGIPVVRGNNITTTRSPTGDFVYVTEATAQSLSGCLLSPGDLVFPHRGAIGEVGLIDGPPGSRFMLSTSLMKLTPDEARIDARYIYYFFRSRLGRDQLMMRASTVGTPGIGQPLASLRSVRIPVPPIEEQRVIAATLGALDDKIDSNRRLIAGAMAILDLQAERAAQGLDRCALRHLVTSVKAPIDVRTLGDDIVEHYSLPAFDTRGEPDRVPASSIMSNKLRVPDGCVLLSRLNPKTNRTWLAHPLDPTHAIASTEWLVALPAPGLRLGAVWLALRDEHFLATLVRRASGTSGSHQRVRPEDLLDIETLDARQLPPAITAEAQELLQLGHQRRIEIARLQGMRDALLPELLSGRLRVPEGQQMVDAVS